MEYDYQILKLSDAFYKAFPHSTFPEILMKQERSYNCLLLEIMDELFVCIPFRTEMHHGNGYHFKETARSRKHRSGLDYSKMVIIRDGDYIDKGQAVVDNDEYRECVKNMDRIVSECTEYLTDYIEWRKGTLELHEREAARRYAYTTLKYFEEELGIVK